jgi:hypothetical protein
VRRLVELIERHVPPFSGRDPFGVLDEVSLIVERALIDRYQTETN